MPNPQPPTHAQLCVLAHHAFDRLGVAAVPADVVDALKWDCARAGFEYRTRELSAAVDAVAVARQKGYRTPRRRAACR